MIYATVILGVISVLLIILLVRQQDRHNRYTASLIEAFRQTQAQLINKVTAPERPIPDGRPSPKVKQLRTPEKAREFARVGTVAPPRAPGTGGVIDHGQNDSTFVPPSADALEA